MRTQGQPPPNCGCSYGDLDIKVSMLFISLYVSDYLDIKRQVGAGIVNRALSFPLKLIAKNAGCNGNAISYRWIQHKHLAMKQDAEQIDQDQNNDHIIKSTEQPPDDSVRDNNLPKDHNMI
ncbi:hypothetical protein Tco_0971506 [Tanacetum coccineum]